MQQLKHFEDEVLMLLCVVVTSSTNPSSCHKQSEREIEQHVSLFCAEFKTQYTENVLFKVVRGQITIKQIIADGFE